MKIELWWCAYGNCGTQKYSRLRSLLRVKGLVVCFYLGWSGSTLQFRQNIIKVGSKSWLLTCNSNITLSLPSALKRELNFCNGYLRLLYFWWSIWFNFIFKCPYLHQGLLSRRLSNCFWWSFVQNCCLNRLICHWQVPLPRSEKSFLDQILLDLKVETDWW